MYNSAIIRISAFLAFTIAVVLAYLFAGIGTVSAADLTLRVLPDNILYLNQSGQQRSVVLENPLGFTIEFYTIILSADPVTTTLLSLDTSPTTLPRGFNGTGGGFNANTGTIVLSKSINNDTSGAITPASIPVGTVTYTSGSTSSAGGLLVLVEGTAVGRLGTGKSQVLSISTAADVLQVVPTATGTPTPIPSPDPTCDLCGYCDGNSEFPDGYDTCTQCLYQDPGPPPANPKEGYQWTIAGCVESSASGFVQSVSAMLIPTAGGGGLLVILIGSMMILTSKGDFQKLRNGRRLVVAGIGAILLIIFSVFILEFVGVNILVLPGFGG
jgi:hypothetical protein